MPDHSQLPLMFIGLAILQILSTFVIMGVLCRIESQLEEAGLIDPKQQASLLTKKQPIEPQSDSLPHRTGENRESKKEEEPKLPRPTSKPQS